jgi:hypothetical protein
VDPTSWRGLCRLACAHEPGSAHCSAALLAMSCAHELSLVSYSPSISPCYMAALLPVLPVLPDHAGNETQSVPHKMAPCRFSRRVPGVGGTSLVRLAAVCHWPCRASVPARHGGVRGPLACASTHAAGSRPVWARAQRLRLLPLLLLLLLLRLSPRPPALLGPARALLPPPLPLPLSGLGLLAELRGRRERALPHAALGALCGVLLHHIRPCDGPVARASCGGGRRAAAGAQRQRHAGCLLLLAPRDTATPTAPHPSCTHAHTHARTHARTHAHTHARTHL